MKVVLLPGDEGSLMADWCKFMMRVMTGEFVLRRNNEGGVKMKGWGDYEGWWDAGCSVDDRVSNAFGSMSFFLLKLVKMCYAKYK